VTVATGKVFKKISAISTSSCRPNSPLNGKSCRIHPNIAKSSRFVVGSLRSQLAQPKAGLGWFGKEFIHG